MASRGPNSHIEAAGDFVTTGERALLTSATFTGLITGGVPLSNWFSTAVRPFST